MDVQNVVTGLVMRYGIQVLGAAVILIGGTTRQLHLLLTVPHGADLTAALTAATDVVTRNERVLKDPAPAVGIAQVTDTGIRIGVNPWVRVVDVGAVEGELNRALVEHFRGRGVGLGLSPSDVRLVNGATAVRT
jgi:small conductance mechanosensitive channel